MPEKKLISLIEKIKNGSLATWDALHSEYVKIASTLEEDKAKHAYLSLAILTANVGGLTSKSWNALIEDAIDISRYIKEQLFVTKQKDYASFFREITYDSKEEMEAVLNKIEENPLIKARDADDAKRVALFKKYMIG